MENNDDGNFWQLFGVVDVFTFFVSQIARYPRHRNFVTGHKIESELFDSLFDRFIFFRAPIYWDFTVVSRSGFPFSDLFRVNLIVSEIPTVSVNRKWNRLVNTAPF